MGVAELSATESTSDCVEGLEPNEPCAPNEGISQMKSAYLALSLAVAVVSTVGLSSASGGHHGMRFEKLDQNGDGKITLPEMSGRVNQRFARLDKNQDGEITREEARFGKHHGKHPARHPARHYGKRRFEKRDVNGDGQLSRDEIPRMPDKKFAKLDRNQDGQLSPSELRPGGKAKKHRRFDKIDTDGDGRVSRAEADKAKKRKFAKMDTNSDGAVDRAEFRTSKGHWPTPDGAKKSKKNKRRNAGEKASR